MLGNCPNSETLRRIQKIKLNNVEAMIRTILTLVWFLGMFGR